MPRRRLHGETQKRRRKPQTRLLKRSESVVRPRATLQPAAFERSTQLSREDLEFLEAMRELEVHRSPWRGDTVARRQALERVHFLAGNEESALFQRSMARAGVKPLGAPGEPPPDTAAPPPPAAAGAPAPRPAVGNGAEAVPPAEPAGEARSAPPEPPDPSASMDFEPEGESHALMKALLEEHEFEPGLKFAGATASPRRATAPAERDDGAEPDDELDLHGKTQEEAIRLVQNFLLVSQRHRYRHVLIITGRGLNSGPGGPVLKDACFRWLEINGKRFARSFVRAPARLGGEGAIWITLR